MALQQREDASSALQRRLELGRGSHMDDYSRGTVAGDGERHVALVQLGWRLAKRIEWQLALLAGRRLLGGGQLPRLHTMRHLAFECCKGS